VVDVAVRYAPGAYLQANPQVAEVMANIGRGQAPQAAPAPKKADE